MPTNAEIKALVQKEVRAQKSHLVRNGLADILDYIIDNITAGPGGTPGIDDVLAEGQVFTANREVDLNGFRLRFDGGIKASGNAGNIEFIAPGSNGANDAGNVIITGGLKADGAGNGGDVIITSGGATTNDVGNVYILGASAISGGRGGHLFLTGGNGEGAAEAGGEIRLTGGTGGGNGGDLYFNAGPPGVNGTSGIVHIVSANANGVGDGGAIEIIAGNGGATSGNGGSLNIYGGNALGTDSNGGDIIFNSGEKTGTGLFGKIVYNYTDGGDPNTMLEIDPNTQTITHTADTHTFNCENFQVLSTDGTAASAGIDAKATTGDDIQFGLRAVEVGEDEIRIIGNAITNKIMYTAHTQEFNGDMMLIDLAGGGTTGLSIDNDGKIIRTP